MTDKPGDGMVGLLEYAAEFADAVASLGTFNHRGFRQAEVIALSGRLRAALSAHEAEQPKQPNRGVAESADEASYRLPSFGRSSAEADQRGKVLGPETGGHTAQPGSGGHCQRCKDDLRIAKANGMLLRDDCPGIAGGDTATIARLTAEKEYAEDELKSWLASDTTHANCRNVEAQLQAQLDAERAAGGQIVAWGCEECLWSNMIEVRGVDHQAIHDRHNEDYDNDCRATVIPVVRGGER